MLQQKILQTAWQETRTIRFIRQDHPNRHQQSAGKQQGAESEGPDAAAPVPGMSEGPGRLGGCRKAKDGGAAVESDSCYTGAGTGHRARGSPSCTSGRTNGISAAGVRFSSRATLPAVRLSAPLRIEARTIQIHSMFASRNAAVHIRVWRPVFAWFASSCAA